MSNNPFGQMPTITDLQKATDAITEMSEEDFNEFISKIDEDIENSSTDGLAAAFAAFKSLALGWVIP